MEKVMEAAKGRIWTGEDALELGLVDALGGFPAALRLAREAMGVEADAPVRLKRFPGEKSLLELILERGAGGGDGQGVSAVLDGVLRAVRPLVRLVRELGGGRAAGVLRVREGGSVR